MTTLGQGSALPTLHTRLRLRETFLEFGFLDVHELLKQGEFHVPKSTMDISAPTLLARLPRTNKPGNIRFGQVFALRNGLKKRRKEICAAVDGNSLNVYEVSSL
jgi:hypothetical protein